MITLPQYLCAGFFFVLCLLHFFSQRALWLDETFILENIKTLGYRQIFGPLEHAQAFPRFYLLIIKFFSSHFDYHVLALRFFPLMCMLAAYLTWSRVYKKVFGDNIQYLLAILTLTCSYHFSYYAGEFKPYSMDVLVVGLFCLFLLNQKEWEQRIPSWKSSIAICLMPLALLFSYAGIFVFWIVACNFLFLARENKKIWPVLIMYSTVAAAALGMITLFDLRHSFGNKALLSYWDSYFICTDSFPCFMESFWEGCRRLSTWWFGKGKFLMQWASFLIPFFLYALVRYGFFPWIKDKGQVFRITSLTAVLFSELFLLGILHKYPFTGERITLFLGPFVFYGLIKGLFDLKRFKLLYYFMLGNYCLFLVVCGINTFIHYCRLY